MQNMILHESNTSPTIMSSAGVGGVVHTSERTFSRVKRSRPRLAFFTVHL